MILSTRALSRTFKMGSQSVRALENVDLDVEAGEMLAVMGSSGSGKSTLLNILGCLDRPSAGEYWLDGERVSSLDDDRRAALRNRGIGFVFQSYNLLPRTTALENVALPLLYHGVPREERSMLAESALGVVGLSQRLHSYPSQLSGGEQQRVAVARAIVTDPLVLLADEPTGALDSRNGRQVLDLLRFLNEEGMTVALVTHDPEVASLARRVVRLHDGRVVGDGPSRDLLQGSGDPVAERQDAGAARPMAPSS